MVRFILAMYIASVNGVYIPTAIKVIVWVSFTLVFICAAYEAWKEIND